MKLPEIRRPSKSILKRIHSLKSKKGEIAVIEPDTGDFYTGKNLLEAVKKARKNHPNNIFYTIRIGYPSAHWHKGGIRKF